LPAEERLVRNDVYDGHHFLTFKSVKFWWRLESWLAKLLPAAEIIVAEMGHRTTPQSAWLLMLTVNRYIRKENTGRSGR